MNQSYSKEELKAIQEIELDILRIVADCCEKLDLKYFLIGGTALGAVRHQGFIPWDDDIDIGMLREDYNVFLEKASKILQEKGLFVQDFTTETVAPYPFIKVRKDNTLFVEYCNRHINMHQGIYIDIFPFDKIPNEIEKQKEQFNMVQKWTKRFVYRQTPDISVPATTLHLKVKKFIRQLLHYSMKLIPNGYFYRKIHKTMTAYNDIDSPYYACLFYPKFHGENVTQDMLDNLVMVDFEKYQFKAISDLDTYLTEKYGDYMSLPPVEERVGHKPYRIKC